MEEQLFLEAMDVLGTFVLPSELNKEDNNGRTKE